MERSGGRAQRTEGRARRIEIEYAPLPSQSKFHASTARFKGFSGPIGSGKSQALCQEAIRLSYLNPGRQGLIGAPTYLDMATVMNAAGLVPYLQFGEVQWWYFPNASGMGLYDAYTTTTFQATYGRPMTVITSNTVDPTTIPDEAAFLPGLIGSYTAQIRSFVKATFSNCRFEVLYPPDVNNFALTKVINYPVSDWTPANLNCLKTESFTYTLDHNLDMSEQSMNSVNSYGFTLAQRSHLVGVSDPETAWLKEVRMAEGEGFESVVLFALDQLCLVGYKLPLSRGMRRSTQLG